MILTEEQIAERAEEYAANVPEDDNDSLYSSDIRAYKTAWKKCTEHYRELIEAGVKWKELKNTLSSILEQYPPKEREDNETKGWIAVNIYDILKSMTRKEIEW